MYVCSHNVYGNKVCGLLRACSNEIATLFFYLRGTGDTILILIIIFREDNMSKVVLPCLYIYRKDQTPADDSFPQAYSVDLPKTACLQVLLVTFLSEARGRTDSRNVLPMDLMLCEFSDLKTTLSTN